MPDVRDEVYEIFNEVGLVFVIVCTSLLGAMGGTTYRYLRWAYVGITSIVMPSMPKVSLTSGGTAFTTIAGVVGYAANTTWVIDRFKPVNQTWAREQVHKERKEKVKESYFRFVANLFEKNWKGTGDTVYLVLETVYEEYQYVKSVYEEVESYIKYVIGGLMFGNAAKNKMSGERVPVVETAVAPPPKKNAPKKNARKQSPARKSNRTR